MTEFNAAFKKWFGDSKVVDERGQPLLVYHGTNAKFECFRRGKSCVGGAIFFGSLKEAKAYAGSTRDARIIPAYLRIEKLWDYEDAKSLSVFAKYLKLDPVEREDVENGVLSGLSDAGGFYGAVLRGNYDAIESDAFQEFLKKHGYDGFTLNQYGGDKNYAVFSPSQIKAVENDGTWDADDPSIASNPPIQLWDDRYAQFGEPITHDFDRDVAIWKGMRDEWFESQMEQVYGKKPAVVELREPRGYGQFVHQTGNSGPNQWQLSFVTDKNLPTGHDIFPSFVAAIQEALGLPGRYKIVNVREIRRNASNPPEDSFPLAGKTVSGLLVRDDVPNTGSISATLGDDYRVLDGIREVPMSAFGDTKYTHSYSVSETERTRRLAREIAHNREINPLIVVVDKTGPYILEGGHRLNALDLLDIPSFPALVVIDTSDFKESNPPEGEYTAAELLEGARLAAGAGDIKAAKMLWREAQRMAT